MTCHISPLSHLFIWCSSLGYAQLSIRLVLACDLALNSLLRDQALDLGNGQSGSEHHRSPGIKQSCISVNVSTNNGNCVSQGIVQYG